MKRALWKPSSISYAIPKIDYSKNKEAYKKMPDIADKELRGNFVKRMSKSQHQKKYENELLESK